MKVYIFGNKDLPEDSNTFKVVEKLGKDIDSVQLVEVKLNDNLPFADGEDVVILDTVAGLTEVKVLGPESLDKLVMSPRNSVHDFDLGFQLKYLKKLGRLGKVKIIGIPQSGKVNYDSIHSIFKKLVAQDMQGS